MIADAICCSDLVDKHMHAAQHAFLAGIAVHKAGWPHHGFIHRVVTAHMVTDS